MPLYPALYAITYTLAGISALFVCGFWLSLLVYRARDSAELWLAAPLFGLAFLVLGASNLNYLGVPVAVSTFPLVGAGLLADVFVARRMGVGDQSARWPLAIAGFFTAVFLAPYAARDAFAAFNDAVYYCGVADFVRAHGYFASVEPAHRQLWLTQMLLARALGARMGAQYFLAEVSALLGLNGYSAFLPTTAVALFVSFCGFWLLARTMLISLLAALLAMAVYASNVAFVQEPANLNWLAQTLGFGPLFALIAFGLAREVSWRSLIGGGLLLSTLVSIYPEVLPIACVPIAISIAIDLFRRHQIVGELVKKWLVALLVAVAVNPYAWFYTLKGVVHEFGAVTAGIDFLNLSRLPLDTYFGMSGGLRDFQFIPLAIAAKLVGASLVVTSAIGLFRQSRKTQLVIIVSGLVYIALSLHQFFIRGFVYSSRKILVYSFFLVPLCAGSGLAWLLKRRVAVVWLQAGAWICLTSLALLKFTLTVQSYPPPPKLIGLTGQMRSLSELESAAVLPKPGELTLIVCPVDAYDRWIPYFFRKPAEDLIKSIYFAAVADRRLSPIEQFDYYLTLRAVTAWKDPEAVLYRNALFGFSKAQTTLVTTNDGWHDVESAGQQSFQWMAKRGRVVILAPRPDRISIQASVGLPDSTPKHLHIRGPGKSANFTLDHPDNPISLADWEVQPGITDLFFETDEEPRTYGSDPRKLNLRFHNIRILGLTPPSLNLLEPGNLKFVDGITEDRWVMAGGVSIEFARPAAAKAVITLTGEALSDRAPYAIRDDFDEGPALIERIEKPGPFALTFSLPVKKGGPTIRLHLFPERTAQPSALGQNNDDRRLGFRISSIKLNP